MDDCLKNIKEKYTVLLKNLENNIKTNKKDEINEEINITIHEILKLKGLLEKEKYGL